MRSLPECPTARLWPSAPASHAELTSPATGSALVWHDGLHRIPDGLLLGVPGDLVSLARSRLLSVRGKVRAAIEPLLPTRRTR